MSEVKDVTPEAGSEEQTLQAQLEELTEEAKVISEAFQKQTAEVEALKQENALLKQRLFNAALKVFSE